MLTLNGEAVPKVYQEPIPLSSLDPTPSDVPFLENLWGGKKGILRHQSQQKSYMQSLLLSVVRPDHVHFS